MNSLRHSGLDLPVYPREQVYEGEEAMRAAASSGVEEFLRFVNPCPYDSWPPGRTFGDILVRADQEFDKVARFCGAQVVEHTWGLAENTDAEQCERSPGSIIPDGFIVVAKVEVIAGTSVSPEGLSEHYDALVDGVDRYIKASTYRDNYLSDMAPHQFMLGESVKHRAGPRLYLVDIEPMFAFHT